MNWTEEQRQAIELRNKNILVAAAAGSGKTAVLVERIKRLILEEKCPVDRMLIVTFTNAAAAEMKEKISKSIKEELEKLVKNGGSKEQILFLKKQLGLLSSANISTFHAFALDVIRRYFYLIHVEPNFKICDTVQENILKGEAMDELLEQLFEEDEPEFYDFLKCYSGDRNENKFREIIDSCYSTMSSLPEPFKWLEKSVQQLKDGRAFRDGVAGEALFKAAEAKITKAEELAKVNFEYAESFNLDKLEKKCKSDMQMIKELKEAISAKDFESIRKLASLFRLSRLTGVFESMKERSEFNQDYIADNRKSITKFVKEIKETLFTGDIDELCHEMDLTYSSAAYLEKLLKRYDELYREKKAEKNLADFSDIEHYAYEILKDPEASEFYRTRFNHIFIDEYQDSNIIQEALIDLIKRPNNLFMVGDVKQSIYKFRLAEPEIFQNKYRLYASGEIEDSVKIDLNKNFRSKKEVVDFINTVFEKTMDGYDENAKLYLGDPYGNESYHIPKLVLVDKLWSKYDEPDDEIKNMIKTEKEALAAVDIIKKRLGENIFDSKQGKVRPLEKRDIVILMRGVKNYSDIYYKILADNNIPAYIDDNDGFFDTIEINTFLSALYIIDNPRQDIQLLTLLRSEMMRFTIEELVEIRTQFKEGTYYNAFLCYSEDGSRESLRLKCEEALKTIESWRKLSKIMPLDKFIWHLLMDTGFYIAMGALPAGSQRQANLRTLTDKALAYRNGKNTSLYGFIRYIEAIKEKKVAIGQVKMLGEKDDLVRIMTIHKSKGLEFPMVIVAGYCRRLNYSSVGKAPLMHKDLGLAFPIVDHENHCYRTTVLQSIIKDRIHREEVEEEKRILYVALTRAKDILVLLGVSDDLLESYARRQLMASNDNSYFGMTGKILLGANFKYYSYIANRELIASSLGNRKNTAGILRTMEACKDIEISDEIDRKMSFVYPYEKDLTVRTKYSVSQLNSKGHKPVESLSDPDFVYGEKNISAVSRGTIYHSVLEHMDIKKAYKEGLPYVENLLKSMVENEILSEKEASVVETKRLIPFISSDIARRISESSGVYKEKRFNLLTDYEGNSVIVRGIIDCYFEEGDSLVLLDYKTGSIKDVTGGNPEAIKEKYSKQLELYKEALEKATGKEVKESYLYMTDAGKYIKL